jgi:hypothetical protein
MTLADFIDIFPEFKGIQNNISAKAFTHYLASVRLEIGNHSEYEQLAPWLLAHKIALLFPVNAATVTAREDTETDLESTKYGREFSRMISAEGFLPGFI